MSPDPAPDDGADVAATAASQVATDSAANTEATTTASASGQRQWASIVSALRRGCLLTLLASIGLFCWWRYTNVAPPGHTYLAALAGLTVLIPVIWLSGIDGYESKRGLVVRLLLMAVLGAVLAKLLKANLMEDIQTFKLVPHESSALLAAGVSYTAALMADLTRRWLQSNPRSDTYPELSRPWQLAVAALPAVLMLANVASPFALLSFDRSVTVPAPAALPQMPSSVTGEVAWTLSTDEVEDVVAGAAGPVLIKRDGAYGLNPEDGSITWSYRLPGTTVMNEDREECGQDRPVVSPDRRHLALRLVAKDARDKERRATHLVVLDTSTGAVTLKRRSAYGYSYSVQLTDSVVADGPQVVRLSDGRTLWQIKLPEKPGQKHGARGDADDNGPEFCGFSGQGGHATLLVPAAEQADSFSLDLFSESGSKVGEVTGVVEDPWSGGSQVRGGWIAQWDDPVAAREALKSQEAQDELIDGAPAHAVNVDALAAGEAAPVPLGTVSGLNTGMTMRSGDLCLIGRRTANRVDAHDPLRQQFVNVVSVLRADTGQVHPGNQDPGTAAASLTFEEVQDGGGRLHLLPGDGSAGTTIEIPTTAGAHFPSFPMPPAHDIGGRPSKELRMLNSPGAVLVISKVGYSQPGYSTIYRVYGIRSK